MPLSENDIQRITRAVVEQLGTRADAETVANTVQSVIGQPAETPPVPPAASAQTDAQPEAQSSNREQGRIIIATFGRNRPGVAAALTGVLADNNCDIADITQKILQEFFSMIMIVDITASPIDFATLREKLNDIESRLGITVIAQHEDVFRAMHRVMRREVAFDGAV